MAKLDMKFLSFTVLSMAMACSGQISFHASSSMPGNRLVYLDEADPFYVSGQFPKLAVPQWLGEPGVDAVVILGIDDLEEPKRYETFLRPVLDRLKQIDGRAPVSIMTEKVAPDDLQVQRWLKEGLSIEVHTLKHPCPFFAKSNFNAAAETYYGCVDLLNRIPENQPVAFRMSCCDSMNSPSPRFYSEIFSRSSPGGKFLTMDSSIMNVCTDEAGAAQERFGKYLPSETNHLTEVSMKSFATTIKNYPYPYLINHLCWEFPPTVPDDWEGFNLNGPASAQTLEDIKANLDVIVKKQGVFSFIFHPYGWIKNDQLADFINYAVTTYGKRVKFLTYREAQTRLDNYLLENQPVRLPKTGEDNGIRLLDLNNDGYEDVVIANGQVRKSRIWNPAANQWIEADFPVALVTEDAGGHSHETGVKFALIKKDGFPTVFYRDESSAGAWHFDGKGWIKDESFFNGLNVDGKPVRTMQSGRDGGVRLRALENTNRSDLLVGNEHQNAIFTWSDAENSWKKLPYGLPKGTSFVDEQGRDMGLRFADLNQDGCDDLIFSNERGYAVYLFIAKTISNLGWERGWSYKVGSGTRDNPNALPMIVRGGVNNNNGAWFHDGTLWVQNEDTAQLPDHVDRRSFTDILLGSQPRAKSAEDSRASLRVPDGFAVELVASEPLVKSPVAIDWGPDGKMWVVEMIDYPLGMDGKWKSGGRICYLEDTNGSGHYEKCTDFLDGVNFPNQVMPWRKGVLVSAAPDIFYAEDSTGQGKADIRRVILSGFNQYNPQHRVNGFEYGLDNWVYAANGGSDGVIQSPQSGQKMDIHGHDLAFNPDSGVFRLEPGETQYGRHRDDWGNWFGNNNSDWGWHFYLPEHYVLRNPFLTLAGLTTDLANYPNQNRVYTIAPLLERFNWPDQIFELTSACSFIPYRDDLFGPEFSNSVFICEPANNVVHREVLEQNGATFSSHRAPGEEKTEFAASTDNWFRPTMAKTGPDGALYIVDMYRLVIEHPAYFPEELRHRPDLRAGDDMGRIYRIFPKGAHLRPIPRLDKMSTAELAAALDDSNGWQRDMAQRLLVQSGDPAAIPLLSTLLRSNARAKTRLQALAALDGLGAATPEILLDAFSDADPHVRSHAVRLAEPFVEKYPAVGEALLKLTEDSDVPVRFQLAFSLGEWNSAAAGRALGKMALNDFEQPQIRTAIMSSATNRIEDISGEVFAGLPDHPPEDALAEQLTSLAAALGKNQALARPIQEAGKPLAAGTASWQLAIGLGLLDGLNQRGVTLADFALAGGDEIKKGLAGLNGIFQQTGVIARNEKLSPAERSLAVRMLAHASAGQDQSIEALGQLLEPAVAPELQEAALDGLKQFHSPHAALVLIGGWRGYSPELRAGVLNALFSRKEWTGELLNAIENKKIQAANLSTTHKQKLLAYSDPAIRERAAKLFARTNADRQRVVKEYQDALELTGNPVHGHELFRANCVLCHRLNGEGNFVGPELGTVVDKPASELLVSILDPNQTVEVTYVAYTAVTADDRELTGVIGSETPNSIVLRLPGGTRETILRKDLKEFKSMGLSLMPEGFETALKKQDLADLIAYITHGASAAKSASRN